VLSKLFAGPIVLELSEPEDDCLWALGALPARLVVEVVGGVAEGFGAGSGELAVEPEAREPVLMAVTLHSVVWTKGVFTRAVAHNVMRL